MRKLVLIGGGGHCLSVLDSAMSMNVFEEIVITDSSLSQGTMVAGCKVVGDDSVLPSLLEMGVKEAFITVGSIESSDVRVRLSNMAKQYGFVFPYIVDPSATVSDYSQIGEGTFVGKNAVVNSGTVIGKHCIVNSGSIIEHNCIVGDYSHISVGAILCGGISVGERSFVGAGTTVREAQNIGENVIIGAGSTVLTDVKDNSIVYGIVK